MDRWFSWAVGIGLALVILVLLMVRGDGVEHVDVPFPELPISLIDAGTTMPGEGPWVVHVWLPG